MTDQSSQGDTDGGWRRYANADFESQALSARVRGIGRTLIGGAVFAAAGFWLALWVRSDGVDARFAYMGPERERSVEDVVRVEALDPGNDEYTWTVTENEKGAEIHIEPSKVTPGRASATVLRIQLDRPIGDRRILLNDDEVGSFP